jgi:hypothetical protein
VAEVRAKVAELSHAWEQRDKAAIDNLIGKPYVHISSDGRRWDRAAYMVGFENGAPRHVKQTDVEVTVLGNTAVVTGEQRWSLVSAPENYGPLIRFTQVWMKEAGTWKRIEFQGTLVRIQVPNPQASNPPAEGG